MKTPANGAGAATSASNPCEGQFSLSLSPSLSKSERALNESLDGSDSMDFCFCFCLFVFLFIFLFGFVRTF